MVTLRIPVQVVFYREDDCWVAHCLEFDLLGHGTTHEEALELLSGAIHTQVEASVDFDNSANLFSPADGKYFRMFAAGSDVAHGEIHLQSSNVVIGDTRSREYRENESNAIAYV